jgi:hypothetical protein
VTFPAYDLYSLSTNTENENKRCKIFNKVLNMNWDYVRGKKKTKGK